MVFVISEFCGANSELVSISEIWNGWEDISEQNVSHRREEEDETKI